MSGQVSSTEKKPWLPPLWFKNGAWRLQRRMYRKRPATVLKRPREQKSGLLVLKVTGRRTGQQRAVVVAYLEDGERFVTLAMNGWEDPAPAWWLNLVANPEAEVDTAGGPRRVTAREATGTERDRLWERFKTIRGWGGASLDRYAALRSRPTPVVVLEPR